MTNYTKLIYNGLTGETTVEELSDNESTKLLEEWNKNQAQIEAEKNAADQLRANKISAYEKLGLTAAEIEALLPTPLPNLSIAELRNSQHNLEELCQ